MWWSGRHISSNHREFPVQSWAETVLPWRLGDITVNKKEIVRSSESENQHRGITETLGKRNQNIRGSGNGKEVTGRA